MADQHEEVDFRSKPREAYKRYRDFYEILGAVLLIATVSLVTRTLFPNDATSFDANMATTIIGTIITILVIDRRNERRAERQYKQQLVDEAGSESNEISKHAVSILRRRELLEGESGLLQGKNLEKADLSGVTLTKANLQGVNLTEGVLRDTQLQGASLVGANLTLARMQGAKMIEVDLSKAKLFCADLESANLPLADLRGTDLFEANLENANLIGVECDSRTRLPDGNFYTSMTNFDVFTDPNHKPFWRSRIAGRPAYPIKARN